MKYSLRERFGYFLERFTFLDFLIMRYEGETPYGDKRYTNRINGHLILRRKS